MVREKMASLKKSYLLNQENQFNSGLFDYESKSFGLESRNSALESTNFCTQSTRNSDLSTSLQSSTKYAHVPYKLSAKKSTNTKNPALRREQGFDKRI
jgi:hypothetical protein